MLSVGGRKALDKLVPEIPRSQRLLGIAENLSQRERMEMIVEWFQHQLQNNDIFAGLAGATLVGPILYYARNIPVSLLEFIIRQATVNLTVTNDDPSFDRIGEWLSRLDWMRKIRNVRLTTWYESDEEETLSLAPGSGKHFFLYKGFPFRVERIVNEGDKGGYSRRMREKFQFTTLGRNHDRIKTLMLEANKVDHYDRLRIHMWFSSSWNMTGLKMKRPARSLILPPGQYERIHRDISWFQESMEWYRARGLPYRRGLLFSGSPGTGKSSLVHVLAGEFDLPVYVLNLSSVSGDNNLMDAFSTAPRKSIILIEDVDSASFAVARQSQETEGTGKNPRQISGSRGATTGVTLSGLLNAVDGVASPEGRILIMTTNRPEDIDEALLRPGRVDVHENFGLASTEEARRLFIQFFGEELSSSVVLDAPVSPASLQQCFMKHSAEEAILQLSHLVRGKSANGGSPDDSRMTGTAHQN